jgi:hypothetical protein
MRLKMINIFAEYGTIGVVVALFAGQILFLQKTLMNQLKETHKIVVALIDRLNKSDDRALLRAEKYNDHIDLLSKEITYLTGRINGK